MRFLTYSLGCKVNGYEENALSNSLILRGHQKVFEPSQADAIIINTCSVTSVADKKSRQRISHFRNANKKAILAVMGCYSQKHAETAFSLGADIVLGNAGKSTLPEILETYSRKQGKLDLTKKDIRHENYDNFGVNHYAEMTRAYLKVQDGCDNFCSYCLIPMVRGNSRSRRPGEAIEEAVSLAHNGYKEIVITGISTGSYGRDLGDGSYVLSDLLRDICLNAKGLERIRISSIEAMEIDDKFLALLRDFPQIVDHIHIPVQSGSEKVLKAMKRHYGKEEFLEKLSAIREIRPEIAITTDAIAGFPGETEEDHLESLAFYEEAGFAEIHAFPYSSRPFTYASTLKQIDPATKKKRTHDILALSKKLRKEYEEGFYGREVEVLVEEFDEESHMAKGHTANYLLCSFPHEEDVRGKMITVVYHPSIASD